MFHGHSYNSGEARRAISLAEVVFGGKAEFAPFLYLMSLMHEFQQIVYCRYDNTSSVARFRVHVVTRLLAEAMGKLNHVNLKHIYW